MGGVNKQRTWSSRAWPCPPERPSAAAFPGTPMGRLLCSLWCGFNHQFVVFPFMLHQLGAEQQRAVPCALAAALDPLQQGRPTREEAGRRGSGAPTAAPRRDASPRRSGRGRRRGDELPRGASRRPREPRERASG